MKVKEKYLRDLFPTPQNPVGYLIHRLPIMKLESSFLHRICNKMKDFCQINKEKDSLVPPSCDVFSEQLDWKSAFFLQDPFQSFHPLETAGSPTNLFLFI